MGFDLSAIVQRAERQDSIWGFFKVLPTSWRYDLMAFWPNYGNDSEIFVIQENCNCLGGGIVFSRLPPDSSPWSAHAPHWFDLGYYYLGYIWVLPQRRGEGLGSFWLQQINSQFSASGFWLTVEKVELIKFYEQQGFALTEKLLVGDKAEWLMVNSHG